jgi:hypothetical protein
VRRREVLRTVSEHPDCAHRIDDADDNPPKLTVDRERASAFPVTLAPEKPLIVIVVLITLPAQPNMPGC